MQRRRRESGLAAAPWAGVALLVVAVLGLGAWMLLPQGAGDAVDPARLEQSRVVEDVGVRVVGVSVVGGGGLVDVRYQVLDPDKAIELHDPGRGPALVDADSGKVLDQPWMGHAAPEQMHAGVTYSVLLVNEGGAVRPGGGVSVVLAGARLDGVLVR